MEEKRLCILYDVKGSPLQAILACAFCMVQSTAHEWIHLLSAVLKKVLDDGGHLPERSPKELAAVLPAASPAVYGSDGTARRRHRPSDPEQQEEYDRGKKKPRRSSIASRFAQIWR